MHSPAPLIINALLILDLAPESQDALQDALEGWEKVAKAREEGRYEVGPGTGGG